MALEVAFSSVCKYLIFLPLGPVDLVMYRGREKRGRSVMTVTYLAFVDTHTEESFSSRIILGGDHQAFWVDQAMADREDMGPH